MEKLQNVGLCVLLSFHLLACGDGDSPKKNIRESAPDDRRTSLKINPVDDPKSAHIDENQAAPVDLVGHMVFDHHVSEDVRARLTKDLIRIERFDLSTFPEDDAALKELLGIPDLSAGTMSSWLKERIKYVLNTDLSLYRIGVVKSKSKTFEVTQGEDAGSSSNTAAVMGGMALYMQGKRLPPEGNYLVLEVNDTWVHINSQRNGVMQIGPALFNANFQADPSNPEAYANAALRIETLFHEARHADGNSVSLSLGFLHAICPPGHDFAGRPGCDSNANGPYTVGAKILKAYIQKCGDLCSLKDNVAIKTILQAQYLDSLSRVIRRSNSQLPVLDTAPEKGFEKVDISSFSLVPAKS